MNSNQALTALIDRVNSSSKLVHFGFDELQVWQGGVLKAFVAAGLLTKTVDTQSLECDGCEYGCFMPVYHAENKQRAFIVCSEPEKQEHMGRIRVPLERLQQWQSSTKKIAVVIAGLLEMESKPTHNKETASYTLGMLSSNKGRRWLTVQTQPLALEANKQTPPISDLLYFNNGTLEIDRLAVDVLLNATPNATSKAYAPNTSKREASKLATQAMYKDWNDKYLSLCEKHPTKSDTWRSQQIAKLPIAQGKDSETIRKNMKN